MSRVTSDPKSTVFVKESTISITKPTGMVKERTTSLTKSTGKDPAAETLFDSTIDVILDMAAQMMSHREKKGEKEE